MDYAEMLFAVEVDKRAGEMFEADLKVKMSELQDRSAVEVWVAQNPKEKYVEAAYRVFVKTAETITAIRKADTAKVMSCMPQPPTSA
jgi:hypothetical protein